MLEIERLPPQSTLQKFAFVAESAVGQTVFAEFRQPANRRAVLVEDQPPSKEQTAAVACDLEVLAVPTANLEDVELLTHVQTWIDAVGQPTVPSVTIMLQGALVLWRPGRTAIIAHADRIETLRKSLLEVSFYEAELRDLEHEISGSWTNLEQASSLAFEFNARSVRKRPQLEQEFQRVVALRVRLARIAPAVHAPHLYPPTLASQIDERLRERTRMLHRHEFIDEQLQVFEGVYEACGQRASDFMLARTGHRLEWTIIILLLAQTIMLVYELLANAAATPDVAPIRKKAQNLRPDTSLLRDSRSPLVQAFQP